MLGPLRKFDDEARTTAVLSVDVGAEEEVWKAGWEEGEAVGVRNRVTTLAGGMYTPDKAEAALGEALMARSTKIDVKLVLSMRAS